MISGLPSDTALDRFRLRVGLTHNQFCYAVNFLKIHEHELSTSAIAIMSDNGEVEVETVSGYQVLPKEVTDEIGSIKLFNKWSYEDVEIRDISLT